MDFVILITPHIYKIVTTLHSSLFGASRPGLNHLLSRVDVIVDSDIPDDLAVSKKDKTPKKSLNGESITLSFVISTG